MEIGLKNRSVKVCEYAGSNYNISQPEYSWLKVAAQENLFDPPNVWYIHTPKTPLLWTELPSHMRPKYEDIDNIESIAVHPKAARDSLASNVLMDHLPTVLVKLTISFLQEPKS